MKLRKLIAPFAPAVALMALSMPASAIPIALNGDFAISFSGNLFYAPGGPLLAATSITLPTNTALQGERISGLDNTYLGAINDFCDAGCAAAGPTPLQIGDTISLSSQTLDLTGASLPTLTFASLAPADTFTFAATGITVARTHVGNADFVNVYYSGLFHDLTNFYTPNEPASLSFAFTQTGGPTGTTSGSGTFAAPPLANTTSPEPVTMSLFGSALVGLGLLGRKRLAR